MVKSFNFEFTSLEDEYRKMLADHITVSVDDLSPNERAIIAKSFELFEGKLEDIKTLNDELKGYHLN